MARATIDESRFAHHGNSVGGVFRDKKSETIEHYTLIDKVDPAVETALKTAPHRTIRGIPKNTSHTAPLAPTPAKFSN